MSYHNPDERHFNTGDIVFIVASAILFLGAIGIFIWLIVDAAEQHLVRNVLFGSAFLLITFGLVYFSIALYNHPRTARGVMWTTLILGLAVYIVGLCVHSSVKSAPADDNALMPRTEVSALEGDTVPSATDTTR